MKPRPANVYEDGENEGLEGKKIQTTNLEIRDSETKESPSIGKIETSR